MTVDLLTIMVLELLDLLLHHCYHHFYLYFSYPRGLSGACNVQCPEINTILTSSTLSSPSRLKHQIPSCSCHMAHYRRSSRRVTRSSRKKILAGNLFPREAPQKIFVAMNHDFFGASQGRWNIITDSKGFLGAVSGKALSEQN